MTFWEKIKKLIGVEPGTRLSPMVSYNSAIFLSGGSTYVIGSYFLTFLTYVEGLSTQQAGMVSALAIISDAISDPIMGVITDRTRHKDGRHRPYIKWGIIPAMITYFCMWTSFGISGKFSSTATMAYYIIVYILFKTAYTFVCVPHTAMLPQLAPDYSLRTQYNAVKTIMDAVASYSSYAISLVFFGLFTTEEFSENSRGKFMMMGLILSLWVTLPLIYTYKGTKEQSSLDEPLEPFNAKDFFRCYAEVFRNRAFLQYFAFSFFITLSSCFVSNSTYYFLKNVVNQQKNYNMLTTLSGVGEALGFIPAYFFSMRKSKQLPAKVFIPVAGLSLLATWFITPATPAAAMFAVELFYGLGLAGMASVQSNILPDITDVDEMITGERREGTISTFSTFIKKFVSGFATMSVGFILPAFGFNTDKKAAIQSPTAIKGLRLTYAGFPIIFYICAVAVICRYELNRDDHAKIKELIKEKHENGSVAPDEKTKQRLEKLAGRKFEEMWIGQ